ncbi:hypothetical protein MTBUT4_310033 [Magnetospirillum sp. UT-4]|nr:hypothetical protein MTBUT4_310033 [Magnetospirillum sp. UT-4]
MTYIRLAPLSIRRNVRASRLQGRFATGGLPVIIKVMAVDYPTASQLARLRYEFELLRSLDHPAVIRVLDLVRTGHTLAMVMEDFGGVTLYEVMAEGMPGMEAKLRLARPPDRHGAAAGHRRGRPGQPPLRHRLWAGAGLCQGRAGLQPGAGRGAQRRGTDGGVRGHGPFPCQLRRFPRRLRHRPQGGGRAVGRLPAGFAPPPPWP